MTDLFADLLPATTASSNSLAEGFDPAEGFYPAEAFLTDDEEWDTVSSNSSDTPPWLSPPTPTIAEFEQSGGLGDGLLCADAGTFAEAAADALEAEVAAAVAAAALSDPAHAALPDPARAALPDPAHASQHDMFVHASRTLTAEGHELLRQVIKGPTRCNNTPEARRQIANAIHAVADGMALVHHNPPLAGWLLGLCGSTSRPLLSTSSSVAGPEK